MKDIFYITLFLTILFWRCSTKEDIKEQHKRLSPRIKKVIKDYIQKSDFEKDSNKIILVFVNNLFNKTKIVITAGMTRSFMDTTRFPSLPNNFYELEKKPILIYDGSNRVYEDDSIKVKAFEKVIEKYDKNLIDAALFHPYIWIIEITENSFNVVKLRGITEEYENELRQLSPLAAPPPIKPVIKFVPPKKHR